MRLSKATPAARRPGPGGAESDELLGRQIADALQAPLPDAVFREQPFILVDARRHHVQKALDHFAPACRRLQRESANADEAGHHALSSEALEDFQDFFALAEAIEHHGHCAHVEGVRAQPNQVRRDALQFDQHHADVLRAFGYFQAEKFFDSKAIDEVISQRVQVIHPIGERDRLGISLVFATLLDTGVEIADIGIGSNDVLAVQFQEDAQHAVSGRVLRSHVEDHCFGGAEWCFNRSSHEIQLARRKLALTLRREIPAKRKTNKTLG